MRGQRPSLLVPTALCVFVSGAASLGLEVVWSRQLKLVFGSTTLAVTTILVAYMLGLGLGGVFGGRLAGRLRNGVRAFGMLEIGIGLYALFVPTLFDLYPGLFRESLAALGFWPAALARFALALVALALPTLLMGASLPVLVSALVPEGGRVGRGVGTLYGANTLGAFVGVLAATFVGFGALGVRGTNVAAALADVAVGIVAWVFLSPRLGPRAEADAAHARPASGPRWTPLVLSYGAVGFTALVYEVSWTRALAMILGSSVYSFATMLAGFLAGIGLGSLAARRRVDAVGAPELLYGRGVLALGLTALAVAFAFRALPDLFLRSFASVGISGVHLVWLGLGVSFVLMLAPTFLLGALFPLVVRLVSEQRGPHRASVGGVVGDVYFVNTIGSAIGAFTAGFVLIPLAGLRMTMAVAVALNWVTAAWIGRRRPALAVAAGVGAGLVLVFPPSWRTADFALGAYYRSSAQLDFGLPPIPLVGAVGDELLFYEEGINGTVSVQRSASGLEDGLLSLRINGKTDASLADMSTQVLSGHLPVLFGGPVREALVIGHASGITAGALTLHALEQVDVCEIEPAVLSASHWFDDYNHRPLERDEVRVIVDDGRSVLARASGQWDVIVSEPSNPWMTGCSNLFTAEFFREADAALRPGGRLLQWIQLYGMDELGLNSILAGLFESFDYAYGFLYGSQSTDLLVIATDEPLAPDDLPVLEELPRAVRRDLSRLRIYSTAELWSTLALLPEELRSLAERAHTVNTDDSMFVELRAPWYLYDETPDTHGALRRHARGVTPLLGAAYDWPAGRLGELGLAYLDLHGDATLARTAQGELVRRGDVVSRAVLEAVLTLHEDGLGRQALDLLDGAARLDPSAFAPRWQRARVLNELGRYEDALEDLDAALAARPEHLDARHERMKSLASLGRMRAAYDEATELLGSPLVETEPRLFAEAALFSGGFGRFDEAIERMVRYLELEPYSPDEWELLAHWYGQLGRTGPQREATRNVTLAQRNGERQLHWLARWHERYGTVEEAIGALEILLEWAPDNTAARADLERLRRSVD
jgi:spermidine synthase